MIILLAAVGATIPLATDTYLPSLPSVRSAFDASTAQAQATLSLFFMGAVAGQFLIGPLSDQWGRRPFVLGCLTLFAVASIACAFAPTIEILMLARVAQAVGAAGASTLSRAIVRDLYEGWAASREFARMNTFRGVVPLICPLLGALIATAFGWRAVFVFVAAVGLAIALYSALRLPETLRHTEGALSFGRVISDYAEVQRDGKFRFYCAIQTVMFTGFFGFLSGSSFILQGGYGLTRWQYSVAFSCTVLGFISGSWLAHRLQGILSPTAIIRLGAVLALIGAVGTLVAMGLRIGGAPAIALASAIYLLGMSAASPYCEAGALSSFGAKAGSAAALNGMVQMIFASFAGLILARALDATPLALPLAEAAAASIALILIVFFRPEKATG